MAFKIAVANKVLVNVKGSFKGETPGSKVEYDFDLKMKRLDQEQINERVGSGSITIAGFIEELSEDWFRQSLILNEDDTPAAFSPDALKAMLRQPGMSVAIYQAYLAQVGAQAKN